MYNHFEDDFELSELLKPLQNVKGLPLNELIYRQIKSLILNGELVSGDRVKELVIAKKLKVSRGPVREANQRLIETGFLKSDAQKGIFVSHISFDELEGMLKIRKCLSPLIADEIIGRDDFIDFDGLVEAISVLKKIDIHNYKDKNYRYGLRFMGRFIAETRNPKLVSLYIEFIQKTRIYCLAQLYARYKFININDFNKCSLLTMIEIFDRLFKSLVDKDRNLMIDTLNSICEKNLFRAQHPELLYSLAIKGPEQ